MRASPIIRMIVLLWNSLGWAVQQVLQQLRSVDVPFCATMFHAVGLNAIAPSETRREVLEKSIRPAIVERSGDQRKMGSTRTTVHARTRKGGKLRKRQHINSWRTLPGISGPTVGAGFRTTSNFSLLFYLSGLFAKITRRIGAFDHATSVVAGL